MSYIEFINNILNTRGRFNCGDNYCERHHIIPKCMGGSNDDDNLIDLLAHEHYMAHKLLALEHPDNDKLVYSWCAMAYMENEYHERTYELTAEEFALLREAKSNAMLGDKNPWFGQHPTDETREKMKNSWSYDKHFTAEIRKKMGDAYRGELNSLAKKVNQYDKSGNFIASFVTMTDAAKAVNGSVPKICECCKGTKKSAYGYLWTYDGNEVPKFVDNRYKRTIE